MKTAKLSDWKTKPLPSEHVVIPLAQNFTSEEMAVIRRGVIPEQMEDKWFIYWSDGELFFHRSWTGCCVYVVKFQADNDGYKTMEARVNRDPLQYGETNDGKDKAMISFLIDVILLHRAHEFPGSVPSECQALRQWSQVGRAMLGERPQDD
ncbi:MAG: hypothetical protein R6W97_10895 [Thiobacillus sp.]